MAASAPKVYGPLLLKETEYIGDASRLYWNLDKKGPSALLESARLSEKTGRYSFIGFEPYKILKFSAISKSADPFHSIRREISRNLTHVPQDLPPFLGGAIGYFSYEAKFWTLPRQKKSKKPHSMDLPDAYFLFFKQGVAIDHAAKKSYLFHWSDRKNFAHLEEMHARVRAARRRTRLRGGTSSSGANMKVRPLTPKKVFLDWVRQAKHSIQEGDIYQANLSQGFDIELPLAPEAIYENLKRVNPGAFFGYLDAGDFQILSGSPERLLRLRDKTLDTRPIAGTRPRGSDHEKDRAMSRELLLSPKERAEHIMLVDLERNDLGRVCEFGSVAVNELMELEDYSHVKHIVSNIEGKLSPESDAWEALRAFFPGGTITGTPKIRCVEIIDKLERVPRGPYTGSLGYFSFTGHMDFNIIIRSLAICRQKARLQVGAGIVADSVPEKEFHETLHKAKAVFESIFGQKNAALILRKLGSGTSLSG